MTKPRSSIKAVTRRLRGTALPYQLASGLSLLSVWGCSDDDGPPASVADAGFDGGATVDAATPDDSESTVTPAATSTPLDSLTADVGRTSAPDETTSSPPSGVDSGAPDSGATDTTILVPDPTSSASAPDSGVAETSSAPDSGVDEPTGPQLPEHCAHLPAAPVAFEEIPGFTSSEDFVFDELGNYVGVDENNNLVRISRDGQKQLWLPAIGSTAGMGILADGSVVICDVGAGSIKRAFPNGTLTTILGGLEYPNGLDIGPDGYVYVAENNADRVRRVNPDTGEFTFVAIGLEGANGVAFSNDPGLLYVGSFEGSGVYRVEIPAPGELGVASVLARPNGSHLPEPRLACPDQQVGVECDLGWGTMGTCQAIANVVDCFRIDPCVGENDGESCDFPQPGLCKDETCKPACDGLQAWDACTIPFNEYTPGVCAPQADGSFECREPSPCDGHPVGYSCEVDGVEGVCAEWYPGSDVYCRPPQPCDGLEEGDVCTMSEGGEGVCQVPYYYGSSGLTCQPPPPCDGKVEGDACTTNGGLEGHCVDNPWSDVLSCEVPPPCEGLSNGDECTTYEGTPGKCTDWGFEESYLYCEVVNPCEGAELGAECIEPYSQSAGTCQPNYWNETLFCTLPSPCDGLELNDSCQYDSETSGVCMDLYENGELQCEVDQCAGLQAGDSCFASVFSGGVCVESEGRLVCDRIGPCANLELGDFCTIPKTWESGTCTEGEDGVYCRKLPACYGQSVGDECLSDEGVWGYCIEQGEELTCKTPCGGREVGDTCEVGGITGTCVEDWPGEPLNCKLPEPCDGASEGDTCTSYFGTGTCMWVTGSGYYYPGPGGTPPVATTPGGAITVAPVPVPVPVPGAPIVPVDYADAGVTTYADGGGVTYGDAGPWNPEPVLTCRPSPDCTGKPDGEACTLENGNFGQCFLQQCREQASPGGIDGLGVDACGYVYASEYVHGNVWRIAPDGTTELIAELPSGWIPNIKWGRDLGGFDRDVMYIADRDQGRLFGMSVGGPGATEYYDLVNAQP